MSPKTWLKLQYRRFYCFVKYEVPPFFKYRLKSMWRRKHIRLSMWWFCLVNRKQIAANRREADSPNAYWNVHVKK